MTPFTVDAICRFSPSYCSVMPAICCWFPAASYVTPLELVPSCLGGSIVARSRWRGRPRRIPGDPPIPEHDSSCAYSSSVSLVPTDRVRRDADAF